MTPVTIPYRISPAFIESHKDWAFIYGCCQLYHYSVEFTQYSVCVGQSNCFGLPTKIKFCHAGGYYFTDDMATAFWPVIDKRITEIRELTKNYQVRIYFPRIGCGGARLPQVGPKTLAHIREKLNEFCNPTVYER